MPELWQPIEGYEGLYEVSDLGRIRSLERKVKKWDGFRTVEQKELRPTMLNNGYLQVTLFKQGHRKKKSVHRIVAEAFMSKPADADRVLHNNDIKTDNRLLNLRWGNHKENMEDAIKNDRCPKGEENKWSKLTEQQVLEIYRDPRSQVDIARDYCVQRTAVQKIKSGESWSWLTKD